MLRFILFVCLFISLEASEIHWHSSYAEASALAKKEKKPMLLYMKSKCGACDYLDAKVFTSNEIAGYITEHFIAVSLSPKNDAPKKMQVKVTPVFHYVNFDGTLIQEDLIGATSVPAFIKDMKIAVAASK